MKSYKVLFLENLFNFQKYFFLPDLFSPWEKQGFEILCEPETYAHNTFLYFIDIYRQSETSLDRIFPYFT